MTSLDKYAKVEEDLETLEEQMTQPTATSISDVEVPTLTSSELPECNALRTELVKYMALHHSNHISSLAKELDCSLAVVSRYIRNERPMSSSFISLVKRKLTGFNSVCDDALTALGKARWMKE